MDSGARTIVAAGQMAFGRLDQLRRTAGAGCDLIGLGPRPAPSRVVLETPALRVRSYAPGGGSGPPLLLVAAPIKRAYIWDLAPQVSLVRLLVEAGFSVFLLEWLDPDPSDADQGLDAYVARFVGQAVAAVVDNCGSAPVLIGHSLGGSLAAMFAALCPERVGGVVLVEAPLHFGRDAGAFAPWVAASPALLPVPDGLRLVPGSVLDVVSVLAAPREFLLDRYLDLLLTLGQPATQLHLRVSRWALDESALPARLVGEVVENLYRGDQFMRGELELAGRRVGPDSLVVPMLNVVDPRGTAIPPSAIVPFHQAAGSPRKKLLEYHGDRGVALQHVGVLVGQRAHTVLWPQIVDWLRDGP
jgi:polyhydroxyalkanoate synthase subunit PhaC